MVNDIDCPDLMYECKSDMWTMFDDVLKYSGEYNTQRRLLSMKVLWTNILIAGEDNLFKFPASKYLKDLYG